MISKGMVGRRQIGRSDTSWAQPTDLALFVIAFYACAWVVLAFLFVSPADRHWFIFPVFTCGALVGIDFLKVVLGSIDFFMPMGLISVIALHFFFLAPLLHMRWQYWLLYINTEGVDWPRWLGRMAVLNFVGWALFVIVRNLVMRKKASEKHLIVWRIEPERLWTVGWIALLVTGVMQVWVFAQFGGIRGYITSAEVGSEAMRGYGVIFMFSESFPIIAMMMFVVWCASKPDQQNWLLVGGAILVFVLARMLFGGLRGSRGSVVWALFWAVGMVHFWVRPVSRRMILAGFGVVIAFMYLYAFYKALGSQFLSSFTQADSFGQLERETNRSWHGLILGDLSRVDVQAFLLFRYEEGARLLGQRVRLAWGETYLGGLLLAIPSIVRPAIDTKVEVGTALLYGGQVAPGFRSSRAYGLGGEALLNFGPWAIPIFYAGYGALVGWIDSWCRSLGSDDGRRLLVPFFSIVAFYFLVWDSDNLVVLFFRLGFVPIAVLWLSSRKIRLE